MPIGVAKERSYLPGVLDGWGEEGCSASREECVRRAAIRDTDDELRVDVVRVDRRLKCDARLVGCRRTAGHEQEPAIEEAQHTRGPAVLTLHLGTEHILVPSSCALEV